MTAAMWTLIVVLVATSASLLVALVKASWKIEQLRESRDDWRRSALHLHERLGECRSHNGELRKQMLGDSSQPVEVCALPVQREC